MGKNKRRPGKRPQQGGGDSSRLLHYAILVAWGITPPISGTVGDYKEMELDVLQQIASDQGMILFDPEVPDTARSILIPALLSRGISKQDISNVLSVSNKPASGEVGVVAGGSAVTMTKAANAGVTWQQNTKQAFTALKSGDVKDAWAQGKQSLNSLWKR